jgi:hypothetical protein
MARLITTRLDGAAGLPGILLRLLHECADFDLLRRQFIFLDPSVELVAS